MSEKIDDNKASPGMVGDLPLERMRELLARLRGREVEAAWELGIHVETLDEALKEFAVRVQALEEENLHLREGLARKHRGYAQLRASMNELLNLHELSETISSSFDIEDILDALLNFSRRCIDYESGGVFAIDEENQRLEPRMLRGGAELLEAQVKIQWEEGIVDWVLREGRPVVIEDMGTLDQGEIEEHSFVVAPLIAQGKPLGVYTLYCRRAKADFTAGELELLGALASQTAVAIENSRLYTDLEKTHEQLKESQRRLLMAARQAAIGQLAAGVAHEVNNPLQIILSRVQLMRMHCRGQQKIMEGLRLVEHNVKRISRIIRALLGFARHRNSREGWTRFDLAQAIRQACALVEHQLDNRLIDMSVECAGDLPEMVGDVGELEQVFINLMLNAQNAMPAGGTMRIVARRDGDMVEVRFVDTGVGIASEDLERIFEPFFTTRADAGGTGLGLPLSYRIVETHQGTLTVESTPGAGSSFIVRLPVLPLGGERCAGSPR